MSVGWCLCLSLVSLVGAVRCVYCLLRVECCVLCVVWCCCWLFVVCCQLFAVRCLLCVLSLRRAVRVCVSLLLFGGCVLFAGVDAGCDVRCVVFVV